MMLQYYAFYLYYVYVVLLNFGEDVSHSICGRRPSQFLNHNVTMSQHRASTFAAVNK